MTTGGPAGPAALHSSHRGNTPKIHMRVTHNQEPLFSAARKRRLISVHSVIPRSPRKSETLAAQVQPLQLLSSAAKQVTRKSLCFPKGRSARGFQVAAELLSMPAVEVTRQTPLACFVHLVCPCEGGRATSTHCPEDTEVRATSGPGRGRQRCLAILRLSRQQN